MSSTAPLAATGAKELADVVREYEATPTPERLQSLQQALDGLTAPREPVVVKGHWSEHEYEYFDCGGLSGYDREPYCTPENIKTGIARDWVEGPPYTETRTYNRTPATIKEVNGRITPILGKAYAAATREDVKELLMRTYRPDCRSGSLHREEDFLGAALVEGAVFSFQELHHIYTFASYESYTHEAAVRCGYSPVKEWYEDDCGLRMKRVKDHESILRIRVAWDRDISQLEWLLHDKGERPKRKSDVRDALERLHQSEYEHESTPLADKDAEIICAALGRKRSRESALHSLPRRGRQGITSLYNKLLPEERVDKLVLLGSCAVLGCSMGVLSAPLWEWDEATLYSVTVGSGAGLATIAAASKEISRAHNTLLGKYYALKWRTVEEFEKRIQRPIDAIPDRVRKWLSKPDRPAD